MEKDKAIEITKEMVRAGLAAWGNESNFYGPPDVDGEAVIIAIYLAMTYARASKSEEES